MSTKQTATLCDFELEVLRGLAGLGEVPPWGAALGAVLGFLKGSGLVRLSPSGRYEITDAGRLAVGGGAL